MFLAEVFYIDIQISMHLKLSLDLWAQKSLYKLAAMDHGYVPETEEITNKVKIWLLFLRQRPNSFVSKPNTPYCT